MSSMTPLTWSRPCSSLQWCNLRNYSFEFDAAPPWRWAELEKNFNSYWCLQVSHITKTSDDTETSSRWRYYSRRWIMKFPFEILNNKGRLRMFHVKGVSCCMLWKNRWHVWGVLSSCPVEKVNSEALSIGWHSVACTPLAGELTLTS